jgi:hypothetical protein
MVKDDLAEKQIAIDNKNMQLEQRIIEIIRVLAPEKQQAVLEFAEFLQNRQRLNPKPNTGSVNLTERGIGIEQAGELRSRLQTFAEDWERPEMAAYNEL